MTIKHNKESLRAKAKKGLIFTQIAYKDSNQDYEDYDITPIQNRGDLEGVNAEKKQIFVIYSDEMDAGKFEYRSAIFIDNDTKEVVVANAGTRLGVNKKGFYDVADDMRLIFNKEPAKIKQAKEVNKKIIELLGDDIEDYNISYTGHSLGAAIADIQAAYMDVELQNLGKKAKDIATTTFDNPGAGNFVDKIYATSFKNRNVIFNTFNNRENFINTLAPQAGNLFEIQPSDQKDLNWVEKLFALMMDFICKKLKNWDVKVIIKICKFFSRGSIKTQLDGHKLSHFEKVFVDEKGDFILKNQQNDMKENLNKEVEMLTKEMHNDLKAYKVKQTKAKQPNHKDPLVSTKL